MNIYRILDIAALYVTVGVTYEFLFGYPSKLVHPIRIMGMAVSSLESIFRDPSSPPKNQKIMGAVVVAVLVVITFIVFDLLNWIFYGVYFRFFIGALFTVAIVATGSLIGECRRVLNHIEGGDIDAARNQLSMLVTRDTSLMEEPEICRTTIETLSENLCDGVIAPLFYLFLGGVPVAMTYKMASTLDSMIGYKNDKYRWFGWAAARLDDVLAWIPARITAGFVIAASFLTGRDFKGSFKIWKRDSKKTESPNSGHPEAAFAGALNIWFGGTVNYFGEKHEKPVIGDTLREAGKEDVKNALSLAKCAAFLCLLVFAGIELAWRLR